MRRHVARQPGIGVLTPCATDPVCLLEDAEANAAPLQLDSRGDAGHAGADHGDLEIGSSSRRRHRPHVVWGSSGCIRRTESTHPVEESALRADLRWSRRS